MIHKKIIGNNREKDEKKERKHSMSTVQSMSLKEIKPW